ncbi:MAG TPA: KEOPS complex subunit Cgi121 [Candidatus Methanoperedens sp.]|nr:KEOPS complex subunit Cgi121 [Candidatus Methanoperedens sp.]
MISILEGEIFIEDIEMFLRKIKEKRKSKDTVILALDADKLAGEKHLKFAIEKAMNSFKTGRNIAKDPGKEIMLYAAGTRQINRAMKIGVHNGKNNIALVGIGNDIDLSVFDEITSGNVLQYDQSKNRVLMDFFNITDEEIKAVGVDKVPELVLERVALVDVMK